ncbi:hypothetical protein HPB52_023225 [Rhipicephalus sanguineus]|uniref:Uncharacterized protein n=1 Tax=Rhipicephalus sanguineus TaxID=34632 RepID=A0A9D4QGC5_RHISA|nr:hypothetical protein HPB52_023225 [Rhipicephalus sanguineus]
MVSRDVLGRWVEVLGDSTLYKHYGRNIEEGGLERLYREAIVPDEDVHVEACPDVTDLDDPTIVATALTLDQHSLVYDEDAVLTIAPGEGKRPVSTLYDTHAEELSFPQVYLGQARCIVPEASPISFSIASSEIRRNDRRGALPMRLLYMAMKVLCHRISSQMTMKYRNNATTRGLSRQDVQDPHKVKQLIEQDWRFMEGVQNIVQYCHKRKSELFAMIRQLRKATVFLSLSSSDVRPKELGVDEVEMNESYAATLLNDDPATFRAPFWPMPRTKVLTPLQASTDDD